MESKQYGQKPKQAQCDQADNDKRRYGQQSSSNGSKPK